MMHCLPVGFIVGGIIPAAIGFLSEAQAGDFPVAPCSSWNGTVVERSEIGTQSATTRGLITKADIKDYCERDPDGKRARISLQQCQERYTRETQNILLIAKANCAIGMFEFTYGDDQPRRASLPLPKNADTSCASGIQAQFKMLCPHGRTTNMAVQTDQRSQSVILSAPGGRIKTPAATPRQGLKGTILES